MVMSVRPSVIALFSYMLWYIELKFSIWLCLNVIQIMFEFRHFASIIWGVTLLLELRILEIHSFPYFFPYMLLHIGLKFCIWLPLHALQNKFECHQFSSVFVGVMPLFELRILEIQIFPNFSPTCFDILSSNFINDFHFTNFRSSSSVVNFFDFVGVIPLFGT